MARTHITYKVKRISISFCKFIENIIIYLPSASFLLVHTVILHTRYEYGFWPYGFCTPDYERFQGILMVHHGVAGLAFYSIFYMFYVIWIPALFYLIRLIFFKKDLKKLIVITMNYGLWVAWITYFEDGYMNWFID